MRESNMNISVWRKWVIVWMVAVLSGFQLRAADPVVVPANTGTADDRRKSFCHLMYHDTYDALGSLPGCQVTSPR